MKLSIVTTLYNSSPTVEAFYRRAVATAESLTEDFEIVMVDDGSPDNSLEIACALVDKDSRVRVVELSRNFGHHKALMAGMAHALGELVFLIDSDLEEPPELLTRFHGRMLHGDWDVVFGYQEQRKGRFIERYGGKLAWYLIERLYAIKVVPNQCTVRLMRRSYVDALLLHREHNTVIGALWVIAGFKQLPVPFLKGERDHKPTYTFQSRAVSLLEGLTSFSVVPLTLMAYVGMMATVIAFALGIFILIRKLFYNMAVGWASLMVSIWFIGGTIIFCLGVIGMYISKIYIETKNRPYVIIRKVHIRARHDDKAVHR
jgi:putative glycosyltransferase